MTEDMPKRLPFLRHEKNRHGTWCWYVRRGSKRVRIRGEYGSDEFMEAYRAAIAGEPVKTNTAARSGTVAWLVARYKESGQFLALAKSSRYGRDRLLHRLVMKAGQEQFIAIRKRSIQAAIDGMASTPHAANNYLIALNSLFKWAVKNDHLQVNPCDGVEPIKAKIDGFHPWTMEEVEQYRAKHLVGTRARLALDLLLFTGLRRSDIIVVGRQNVKDGVLSIRTKKTGAMVHIPIFPELRASIDATKTGDMAFLTAERGKPFATPISFGAWFRKQCDDASLPKECSAHGLRKAGATIAAEGGATAHELMAMFGWSRISMAEVYTKDANKKILARAAAERIADKFAPHLENKRAAPVDK
ncbi:MAG: tyrosine-type recombinase/integrase [Mesorhizobium sp.]